MNEKPFSLLKYNHKSSRVVSGGAEKIGHGKFGSVEKVDISLEKDKNKKEFTLARKKFRNEDLARKAFDTYSKLKALGLKVPPTYRINSDHPDEIFMTNYKTDSQKILSNNSFKKERLIFIESVENMNLMIQKVIEQCELAAKNRIKINSDALFFILNVKDKNIAEIDFVIGDLDLITEASKKELQKDILKINLLVAERALIFLFIQLPYLKDGNIPKIFRDKLSKEQLVLIR